MASEIFHKAFRNSPLLCPIPLLAKRYCILFAETSKIMTKLISATAALLLALTQVIRADFQVWTISDNLGQTGSFATSQEDFTCAGMNPEVGATTRRAYPDGCSPSDSSCLSIAITTSTAVFHLQPGLCNAGQLDMYQDGNTWDIYAAGTTDRVGQCYVTGGTTDCTQNAVNNFRFLADHIFYCYSSACS